MVQLVDDLRTGGGGHREHLVVLGINSVFGGKLGIAVHRSALGGKDVIQRLVCAVATGEVVVARIKNIGPCAVGVIGTHFLLGHVNGEGYRLSSGYILLQEAHQLHRCLLNTVGLVVIGIRRLHINFYHFAAIYVGGVGHIHCKGEFIPILSHGIIGILKGTVTQAIAKGECHGLVIVKITSIALTQDHILIPGLVVAVADVNTLLVGHIILIVGALETEPLGCGIGIASGVSVLDGGRSQVVIAVGVHQLARRIHRAVQQVTDCVDAALTNLAYPEACIHSVISAADIRVQEIQLHCVSHVQQDDNLAEVAALFELSQLAQQVLFLFGELKNIAVAVASVVPGQVRALAAHAGNHKDGSVSILLDTVPFCTAIHAQRHLVGGILGIFKDIVVQAARCLSAAIALPRALGVKGPHGGIDRETIVL